MVSPWHALATLPGVADVAELAGVHRFGDHSPEFLERLIGRPGVAPLDLLPASTSATAVARLSYAIGRDVVSAVAGDATDCQAAVAAAVRDCAQVDAMLAELLDPFARSVGAAYGRGRWDGAAAAAARHLLPEQIDEVTRLIQGVTDEAALARHVATASATIARAWSLFLRRDPDGARAVLVNSALVAAARDLSQTRARTSLGRSLEALIAAGKPSLSAIRVVCAQATDETTSTVDAERRARQFVVAHGVWIARCLGLPLPSQTAHAETTGPGWRERMRVLLFTPPGPLPGTDGDPNPGLF